MGINELEKKAIILRDLVYNKQITYEEAKKYINSNLIII